MLLLCGSRRGRGGLGRIVMAGIQGRARFLYRREIQAVDHPQVAVSKDKARFRCRWIRVILQTWSRLRLDATRAKALQLGFQCVQRTGWTYHGARP